MKHRDGVFRMIDAIRTADIEAYAELFADDAVMHHPLSPEPIRGRGAIRASEQALFEAFSEIEIEVLGLYGADEGAAVEVILRASNTGPLELGPGETLPATQRRIALPAVWCFAFAPDGRVRLERDYFDTAMLMAQLGIGAE